MRQIVGWLLVLAPLWTLAGSVRAQAPHSYALVIGSNRGGSGQGTLTFAQRDAQRMAALLSELGRTPRERIERLEEPSAAEIEAALARLRERLARHAAAGEQSQLIFYYSGHARAHALSLGDDELALSSLRRTLLTLPSTLTVVVLDACQSGAFSGVKGAAPAADFSVSSVQNLHSSGIAVMASSTATELSQESHELGSSYFTHHLMVALRGAGDVDRNGRVSLDEAYHYAYERTLSDTARTQVGSQHATLETELTGRGDVPLTYPVDADAQLALPAALEGRVLVQMEQRGAVVAELVKARGAPLLLALPSGRYELLLRAGASARVCAVALTRAAVHTLDPAQCRPLALPSGVTKLPPRLPKARRVREQDPRPAERWFFEVGFATQRHGRGDYVRTLRTFDFAEEPAPRAMRIGYDAALGIGLQRHLQLVVRGFELEERRFARGVRPGSEFEWRTHALSAGLRARAPLARHWFVLFAEATIGAGFGSSSLHHEYITRPAASYRERHRGLAVRGEAGFIVGFGRHVGMYAAAGYVYAPVLENELGERHDSGGITFTHGLRINAGKGWW